MIISFLVTAFNINILSLCYHILNSNVYDTVLLSNIVYIFDKLGYDGLKLVCKS